jgi:hypothetical protein
MNVFLIMLNELVFPSLRRRLTIEHSEIEQPGIPCSSRKTFVRESLKTGRHLTNLNETGSYRIIYLIIAVPKYYGL